MIRETAAIGGMRVKTIDQHTIGTWVRSRVGVLVPHKGKERMCNSSLPVRAKISDRHGR